MPQQSSQRTSRVENDQQRQSMIECTLRPNRVKTEALLDAFATVNRHHFVPPFVSNPYLDQMISICNHRMIWAPLSLGLSLEYLQIQTQDRVLIIGANFGYGMAILSQLSDNVCAVEEDIHLFSAIRRNLAHLEQSIFNSCKSEALKARGPFDYIFIEGAVEEIPEIFLIHLAPKGKVITLHKIPGKDQMCQLKITNGKGRCEICLVDTPGIVMTACKAEEQFTL